MLERTTRQHRTSQTATSEPDSRGALRDGGAPANRHNLLRGSGSQGTVANLGRTCRCSTLKPTEHQAHRAAHSSPPNTTALLCRGSSSSGSRRASLRQQWVANTGVGLRLLDEFRPQILFAAHVGEGEALQHLETLLFTHLRPATVGGGSREE